MELKPNAEARKEHHGGTQVGRRSKDTVLIGLQESFCSGPAALVTGLWYCGLGPRGVS